MNPLPRPRPAVPELPFPEGTSACYNNGSWSDESNPEAAGFPWDHCPNCGERLVNQRCTYRCTRCHYFMSCSDFD